MRIKCSKFGCNALIDRVTVVLMVAAGYAVEAYSQTEAIDTLGHVRTLDEVLVTPKERIISADKTMYFPTKEMKSVTNNGIQLLSVLQIPGLIIDPASGSVSLAGSSRLQIRINGRVVTESDLLSISAKDISRTDFIPNPGTRYGDVDAVLDITLKRRDSGCGIVANMLQSPNRGWGNYTASLKYNVGRSEWSLDYNSNPMWNMDCYRDNIEHVVLPDGTHVNRNESGIKTPNRMVTHRLGLQYSYAVGNRLLLNLQARLTRGNDRYVSNGYITTDLDGVVSAGFESENMLIKNWQGDLDIYMHYRLNRRNKIFINVIPTVNDGSNDRIYDTPDMRIISNIRNRDYHLLLEGIWEGTIGRGVLSAGIRSQNGWIRSSYLTANKVVRETDTYNQLFAEWRQSVNNVEYSAGVAGTLYKVMKPLSYTSAFVNPRFSVRYRPFTWGSISVVFNTNTVAPSVNQIAPALQRIDRFLWSVGNSDLKPFQKYEQKIEFEFNHNDIYAMISVVDRYCHNPIMGSMKYVDDDIVGSYANAGYNNDVEVRGMVRIPLFVQGLSLSVDGGWHRTVSKGADYCHTYSQPFVNAQLMYMIKGWWIMARYNNTYNRLWGEMITSVNQNLLNFGIGYTWRAATFSIGMVNPFGNVSIRTQDLGEPYSYERKYQAAGSRKLVWLGVTLNLHKGKKRSTTQKKLDNSTKYESINNSKK